MSLVSSSCVLRALCFPLTVRARARILNPDRLVNPFGLATKTIHFNFFFICTNSTRDGWMVQTGWFWEPQLVRPLGAGKSGTRAGQEAVNQPSSTSTVATTCAGLVISRSGCQDNDRSLTHIQTRTYRSSIAQRSLATDKASPARGTTDRTKGMFERGL